MKNEPIPEWIIKYDQNNYQSSAGKAIRYLLQRIKESEITKEKASSIAYDALAEFSENGRLNPECRSLDLVEKVADMIVDPLKYEPKPAM